MHRGMPKDVRDWVSGMVAKCNTVVRPSDDLSLVFTSVQEVKSDQYRVSYYETAELNGSDSSGSRGQ